MTRWTYVVTALVAVHAVPDLPVDPEIAALVDWRPALESEHALLTERLAGWRGKYPDVEVTPLVVRGGAAHALVEQSRTAQLVVVGSHGWGGVAGFLLGSVSQAVLHRGHCPVAVVRPDTSAP